MGIFFPMLSLRKKWRMIVLRLVGELKHVVNHRYGSVLFVRDLEEAKKITRVVVDSCPYRIGDIIGLDVMPHPVDNSLFVTCF